MNDNLFVQSYEPVALYVDGEYWGVAALRDRITINSIVQQYGLDARQTALLKYDDKTACLVGGASRT